MIMGLLHNKGIGAVSDQMYFFFSGPRLFPVVGPGNLIAAFVIVLMVSAASTTLPRLLGDAHVSPLRAMQTDE